MLAIPYYIIRKTNQIHCCRSTEAVIRLVVSVLVGVATFAVLVYTSYPQQSGDKKLTL